MPEERNKLKLGKGAAFVKTRLKYLPQGEDTWEADFFPIPRSDGRRECMWMGMVLSHAHNFVLARRTFAEPPSVNDLARLLADAMQRPLAERIHRPQRLYLRAKPEWVELLPHLEQIGINVVSQQTLPKWDQAFGDLQAQVEQALSMQEIMPATEAPARRSKARAKGGKMAQESIAAAEQGTVRIYTLDVFLPRRRPSTAFAKNKSGVSRVIQIRGDQTLEDLHHAIFYAFDREEEHLYEFQLGKGPRDRQGPIYGLQDDGGDNGGLVSETTIDSLRLRVGRSFGYLFDFGDDWQHQINVEAIEEAVPQGQYPRVTKKVGKSPPQYPDWDE